MGRKKGSTNKPKIVCKDCETKDKKVEHKIWSSNQKIRLVKVGLWILVLTFVRQAVILYGNTL